MQVSLRSGKALCGQAQLDNISDENRKVTVNIPTTNIFGCRTDLVASSAVADFIVESLRVEKTGYICVANTHQVVNSRSDTKLKSAMENALLVTSDSKVLAKTLALLGHGLDGRVLYGPDILIDVAKKAEEEQLKIALFGATKIENLAVVNELKSKFPKLKVVGLFNPPNTDIDNLMKCDEFLALQKVSADITLVSLGCPKQEKFMHATDNSLPGIKIGLGGAFGFVSGRNPRSPNWVHRYCLEWLYRLLLEPKRLARRYIYNNTFFSLVFFRTLTKKILS